MLSGTQPEVDRSHPGDRFHPPGTPGRHDRNGDKWMAGSHLSGARLSLGFGELRGLPLTEV
jgi:hypothetical protein